MQSETIKMTDQRGKIHPHKFALWVAMGSIVMMFAGLTSAYLVRKAQGNWRIYDIPTVMWVSTAVILLSSLTIFLAGKAYKNRQIPKYRNLLWATLILGTAFCGLQIFGFYELYQTPQMINISGEISNEMSAIKVAGNPSESFLFIIAGLHILHIVGGLVALLINIFKSYRRSKKVYTSTPVDVVATYWHFVDVLWLYLFIFFLVNH